MAIKQPNSIIGNSQLLTTLGMKDEIFNIYYPRRDHAQHVADALLAINTYGNYHWLNTIDWQSKQYHPCGNGILKTDLSHFSGIAVSITDTIPPRYPVFMRCFEIDNNEIEGSFYTYFDFEVGGMREKNAGFYDEENDILVQYWQNNYVGVVTTPPFDEWQLGKTLDTAWWTSAKWGIERGELQKNKEEIGNMNMAARFPLETKEIIEYIIFAETREELYNLKDEITSISPGQLITETCDAWNKWIARGKNINMPDAFTEYYHQSLHVLRLLFDEKLGSMIAAPEFDHAYEECGGYGFCWNRDTVEAVYALQTAGYPEYLPRFIGWCKKTQLRDGSWFQRYWLDGTLAPSWGNFDYSTQIDETASTIYAMARYGNTLPCDAREDYIDEYWETIKRGAEYLMRRTGEGLHSPCLDLWETYYGCFTYTNAAISAALEAASTLAEDQSKSTSLRYRSRAKWIKESMIERLWMPDAACFAKGIIDGEIYPMIDASVIGVVTPFRVLDLTVEDEREKIIMMLNTIEDRLNYWVDGTRGIRRYENDEYMSGNPWVVTTLWLMRAELDLAEYFKGQDDETYRTWVKKTDTHMDFVTSGATSTKLLPEQVDKYTGNPAWAIPLGWSSALFIEVVHQLNRILK
ncbi:MAG TPA: glucan 1,4-alpha-glucosidase [Candidatus Methanoperedenaceae archaeon]|nr:glucan 1,4-alpha-glucosidase [Candidatus Methanoperedenaceae archaeon]